MQFIVQDEGAAYPKIGLRETLAMDYEQGNGWRVVNEDYEPYIFLAYGETQVQALTNYLRRRLESE